ncbi:MAG TPA: tRNA uridine-5-carboxymethylaminomethyl(34) synthesis GTPase MnmE [Pyrinomonadaceae bacterium]|nr:tRNA uridine-5-carboxymethylaminomethyl(34) synthesis GTPase MnmE [Pyrinomonadaceae bacterium]
MSTIVALSTPPGRSAVAVIRLSGSDSLNLLAPLVNETAQDLSVRRPTLKTIYDPGTAEVIDRALVTFMRAPNSFTGEDLIEISCHGSPIVVRRIIDSLLDRGARLAGPGEFTLRALSNAKLDLSQAEAIRDLIDAQTDAAARQAVRQLNGELSLNLQSIKSGLVDAIVRLESALEFVEDDLPAVQSEELATRLKRVASQLVDLAATYNAGHWVRDGIKVTIAGRPNVGKSSVFNSLLRRDRAIVTSIPGTTRDTLSETVNISGLPVSLTDTAGIRATPDAVESFGIDRAHRAIADADLVMFVIDGTVELDDEDRRLLSQVRDSRYLVVVNKCDLPDFKADREKLERLDSECISISALRGDGLDKLGQAIVDQVAGSHEVNEGFLVTDARHFDLLNKSSEQVQAALKLIESRASEELILVGLHNALALVGSITGETTSEDILSEIFSTFCIGK